MGAIAASLSTKVLLILAIAILPLAGLALYLAVDEGSKDIARARADQAATVHLVSLEVSHVIQSTRDLLLGFNQSSVMQRNSDFCNEQLTSLRPSFPQFVNMVAVDNDLHIVCSAGNPGDHTLRLSAGDRELLDRVRASRRIEIGTARIGMDGKPTFPVVDPIAGNDGRIAIYFFVRVDADWLNRQVNRIDLPAGAILLLLDAKGNILARNPKSDEWQLAKPAPAYERILPATVDFTRDVKGDDGIDRLYSIEKVPDGGGLVVTGKTRSDDIYRPSRRRLTLHLAGLAAMGLIVVALTWIGARRYITRPLSALIRVADRLAAGDAAARSGLPYKGEIGTLARSFDAMASALEQEQNRTALTSQAFRLITEGTSATTGVDFFQSLVVTLTSALKADFALVGELTSDPPSVSTLAVCAHGKILPNFVYDLRGTPCEGVMDKGSGYYPSGVQEKWPEDAMLREMNTQSYLGLPLLDENGTPLGLIAVLHSAPMSEEFIGTGSMLTIFAARASVELKRLRIERALHESMRERERMVGTLRALTARLQSVREEERSHIAREIHDALGQQLTAMRFDVVALRKQLPNAVSSSEAAAPLLESLTELNEMVDSMIKSVRRIATELRPGVLDTFGLIAAIEWLAGEFEKRTKIACIYESPADLDIDRELSTTVFRICQESLTNVARHSGATEVRIALTTGDGFLTLEVGDNGSGLSGQKTMHGDSLGIVGMKERARIAGGNLEVLSEPGRGVTVVARLPLRPSPGTDSPDTSEVTARVAGTGDAAL